MIRLECEIPDLEPELAALLLQIPAGCVTTYGCLAEALGTRHAARWVGEFLRDHDHSPACVCHRVVRKGGAVGLYVRGRDAGEKIEKLEGDGIRVADGIVEHFDERLFLGFQSERPLGKLIEFQEKLARRIRLEPFDETPRLTAGFDVSYQPRGDAVGACAVVETASGRLIWSITHRRRAALPYIPSLLTFRELPLLLELFDEVQRHVHDLELLFVDGNGILHPRGAGVAAALGVLADVPTIGVAKSLLCGRIGENEDRTSHDVPVSLADQVVAMTMRRNPTSRPVYVSPGQRIDVAGAARIVRLLTREHRLPQPLFWADRLSREEVRRSPGFAEL